MAFLRAEYPLFAGRIEDCQYLDFHVFGVSALGGDFADSAFKDRFLKGEESGFVATGGGNTFNVTHDVTAPVAWVIGGDLSA